RAFGGWAWETKRGRCRRRHAKRLLSRDKTAMYALLLVLSVVSTAIGVFAIGFGIPNHEFGLGNTLIVSGSVAIVGGMITFGLAAAVRQLRRIADAVGQRPVPVSAPRRQPAAES